MTSNKGVDYTITLRVSNRRRYIFGFTNEDRGPGYYVEGIYYGRPTLHLGFAYILLPVILLKQRKIIRPGWKYWFVLCNKKLPQ